MWSLSQCAGLFSIIEASAKMMRSYGCSPLLYAGFYPPSIMMFLLSHVEPEPVCWAFFNHRSFSEDDA
jgi:hypothetical protein